MSQTIPKSEIRNPKSTLVAWLSLLLMAVVALGVNVPVLLPGESLSQTFADVPIDSGFWSSVERLSKLGLVTAYPCGGANEPCDEQNRPYFRWGSALTRGELARLVAQAKGWADTPTTQTFADVPTSDPSYLWAERAALQGVMRRFACGPKSSNEPCDTSARPYFRPNSAVTRAGLAEALSLADREGFRGVRIPALSSFQDVPQDDSARPYIEQVYALGIMKGYDCGSANSPEPCVLPYSNPYFHPESLTTLGQAAKALLLWINVTRR